MRKKAIDKNVIYVIVLCLKNKLFSLKINSYLTVGLQVDLVE